MKAKHIKEITFLKLATSVGLSAQLMAPLSVQAQQAPAPAAPPHIPTATQTDPNALGWMKGSPPPPDKQIRFSDGSLYRFPQFRWSFSNWRQLAPTTNVSRGDASVSVLPRALRTDLDQVRFTPIGKTEQLTWEQAFNANFTDGIVVLHKGRIVYERYGGALNANKHHIGMSVTKSFFGTLGAVLLAEGKLKEDDTVAKHVPELANTGFGDATIRQLLDMRTGIKYSENYADPQAEVYNHVRAGGVLPRPPGYNGPNTFYEFLQTVQKEGTHGGPFAYKTVNTDALGWVIRRVAGQSVGEFLEERVWRKMGMESDAYFAVDSVGNEFAGGGLNTVLRDLARFGEMMRNNGNWNGQQIIPAAVVQDIAKGGDKQAFPAAAYPTLPGASYRNMWWNLHNAHGAYMARGVHGQAIYIDPKAEMVIALYATFPMPGNVFNDPTSLPAYQAIAEQLMKN